MTRHVQVRLEDIEHSRLTDIAGADGLQSYLRRLIMASLESKEEKKGRAQATINPSPDSWKRFKMAALDRDINLSDAVDQAIEAWATPMATLPSGIQVPTEITTASPEEMDFMVAMLRAYRRADKRARMNPEPTIPRKKLRE